MKTIDKNNILIAKFMGFREPKTKKEGYTPPKGFPPDPDPYEGYDPTQLAFNKSFDWLMPVIDKIESYQFSVTMISSGCGIKQWEDCLDKENFDLDFHEIWTWGGHCIQSTRLEAIYNSIIEFIKWQNENNNNR